MLWNSIGNLSTPGSTPCYHKLWYIFQSELRDDKSINFEKHHSFSFFLFFLFFLFFFAFHFLGLPKWKFPPEMAKIMPEKIGKSDFTPGKNREKWLCPPPKKWKSLLCHWWLEGKPDCTFDNIPAAYALAK